MDICNTEYPSIPNVWERDPSTNHKTLAEGKWTTPVLELLRGIQWEWTEKVDGTNIRLIAVPGNSNCLVRGRGERSKPPEGIEEATASVREKLTTVAPHKTVIAYGEGYGGRIQNGGLGNYNPNGVGFVLFDLTIDGRWVRRDVLEGIAKKIGADVVPVVGRGTLDQAIRVAREGFSSGWGDFPAEGLVTRPLVELTDYRGNRVIAKVKTRDFRISGPLRDSWRVTFGSCAPAF